MELDAAMEKARELGRLLGQTPEYQALVRARSGVGADRELVAQLNRLEELERRVARGLQQGVAPDQELQEEYERVFSQVQAGPAYQALVAAQANFDKVLARVNEEIGHGLETASKSRIILPS